MTAERGGRFEAAKTPGVDVGRPDAGGLAQRVESGTILRFAIFDQTQPFAQHFACVLVASGRHKLFDEVCLVVGEDDITGRHGSLARIGECWHNMPKALGLHLVFGLGCFEPPLDQFRVFGPGS